MYNSVSAIRIAKSQTRYHEGRSAAPTPSPSVGSGPGPAFWAW